MFSISILFFFIYFHSCICSICSSFTSGISLFIVFIDLILFKILWSLLFIKSFFKLLLKTLPFKEISSPLIVTLKEGLFWLFNKLITSFFSKICPNLCPLLILILLFILLFDSSLSRKLSLVLILFVIFVMVFWGFKLFIK